MNKPVQAPATAATPPVAVKPDKAVKAKAAVATQKKKTVPKTVPKTVLTPAAKAAPKTTSKAVPVKKQSAKAAAKKAVAGNAVGKPAAPGAAKPTATAAAAAVVPAGTKQKAKLVRDSFTIPADEYQLLVNLKQRAAQLAHHAKKSEILRAGVQVLISLSDARFLAALAAVPSLKTGRPKQESAAPVARSGKKSVR